MESMRCTPMVEVLRDLGLDTRHTGKGMFFSPFHDEKTPSFHIDEEQHKWFDHGNRVPCQKAGGDVFDLVMAIKSCTFPEACEYLVAFHPDLSVNHDEDIIDIGGKGYASSLDHRTIDRVLPSFRAYNLKDYAQNERHIPLAILNRYCREVHYTNHYKNGTSFSPYAIGFQNIDGDWALRWPSSDPRKGKVSTGQNYTVVAPDGSFVRASSLQDGSYSASKAVVVFEGFMDFMSWLAWKGKEIPERADVVVLNSVTSNTVRAMEFITKHDYIVNYIDTDETGDKYAQYIKEEIDKLNASGRHIEYHDNRQFFSGLGKDVNEAWVKVDRQRQSEAFEAKMLQTCRQKMAQGVQAPAPSEGPKIR